MAPSSKPLLLSPRWAADHCPTSSRADVPFWHPLRLLLALYQWGYFVLEGSEPWFWRNLKYTRRPRRAEADGHPLYG